MQFSLHPQPTYLRVEMSGMPTPAEVHSMFVEMARQKNEPARALIELRVEQCLSFMDTMQVMSQLSSLGFPSNYRLALVITDEKMRASAAFAETVGVNRGIAVRVFEERDVALRWLGP